MAATTCRRRGLANKTGRASNIYNHPDPRYSLRDRPGAFAGGAVPPLPPPNNAGQAQVDRINRNIPKTWPFRRVRRSNASRGIKQGRNNECYRLAALQCILHMPRAMNWIMSHNDGKDINGVVNQCTATTSNCLACAMKRLIRRYWKDGTGSYANGEPPSIALRTPALQRVHNLANADPNFARGVQGDPHEFLIWVLRTCRDVPVLAPHRALWRERYDALFMVSQEETRFCHVCSSAIIQAPPTDATFRQPEFGFPGLSPTNRHTPGFVSDLVYTHMADEAPASFTRLCSACAQNQCVRKSFGIEKAPEYLTIRVQTHRWSRSRRRLVQINPVGINDILDLTQYHTNPGTILRYKLLATTSYSGTGSAGHWVATVRRHPRVYAINSGWCERRNKAFLLQNPHDHGNKAGSLSSFQTALLIYARQ